jgi:cyclase
MDRRTFLKTAMGSMAGAACSIAGLRFAAAQGGGAVSAAALRDGLVQLSGAGGNVVVAETAEGLVMVDSGAPEHAGALMEALAEAFGERPVAALFNTHWHLEHTGGNDTVRAPRIIAHENTRLWMTTHFYVRSKDFTITPRAPEAVPNETFHASDPQPIEARFGDRRIEYAHLPEAHTDGDIYVRFTSENVIVAGNAVSVGAYPEPDYSTGGWVGGLVDATETLLGIADADTLIVPGRGPAVRRAHLEAQLEMLSTVRRRMETRMREGRSVEELLREGVTAEFDADWGDPERFVTNAYHGLWWVGRTGAAF